MISEESVYMECNANNTEPNPVAAYAHDPSLDGDLIRGDDSDLGIYWFSFLLDNMPLTAAMIPRINPVPFQP
jgi:hypothetical protein